MSQSETRVQTTKAPLPPSVDQYKITSFDRGVFAFELLKLNIVPSAAPLALQPNDPKELDKVLSQPGSDSDAEVNHYEEGIQNGTYHGTQIAITDIFNLIEQR
jgi:hypothetical protein